MAKQPGAEFSDLSNSGLDSLKKKSVPMKLGEKLVEIEEKLVETEGKLKKLDFPGVVTDDDKEKMQATLNEIFEEVRIIRSLEEKAEVRRSEKEDLKQQKLDAQLEILESFWI